MASMKKKTASSRHYGVKVRGGSGIRPVNMSRRRVMEEIERLRQRLAKLKGSPISGLREMREIHELRAALKRKVALMGGPTRNFSKQATKAASKFRGLRTAHVDTHLRKERAEAIKRAFEDYYGVK
jgi:hypothetical protein